MKIAREIMEVVETIVMSYMYKANLHMCMSLFSVIPLNITENK